MDKAKAQRDITFTLIAIAIVWATTFPSIYSGLTKYINATSSLSPDNSDFKNREIAIRFRNLLMQEVLDNAATLATQKCISVGITIDRCTELAEIRNREGRSDLLFYKYADDQQMRSFELANKKIDDAQGKPEDINGIVEYDVLGTKIRFPKHFVPLVLLILCLYASSLLARLTRDAAELTNEADRENPQTWGKGATRSENQDAQGQKEFWASAKEPAVLISLALLVFFFSSTSYFLGMILSDDNDAVESYVNTFYVDSEQLRLLYRVFLSVLFGVISFILASAILHTSTSALRVEESGGRRAFIALATSLIAPFWVRNVSVWRPEESRLAEPADAVAKAPNSLESVLKKFPDRGLYRIVPTDNTNQASVIVYAPKPQALLGVYLPKIVSDLEREKFSIERIESQEHDGDSLFNVVIKSCLCSPSKRSVLVEEVAIDLAKEGTQLENAGLWLLAAAEFDLGQSNLERISGFTGQLSDGHGISWRLVDFLIRILEFGDNAPGRRRLDELLQRFHTELTTSRTMTKSLNMGDLERLRSVSRLSTSRSSPRTPEQRKNRAQWTGNFRNLLVF